MDKITMSVGRDYATAMRYEFVIFKGELVIRRRGCFLTSTAAKRAGLKLAREILEREG